MGDYEAAVDMIREHLDEADFEAQPEERVERAEQVLASVSHPLTAGSCWSSARAVSVLRRSRPGQ